MKTTASIDIVNVVERGNVYNKVFEVFYWDENSIGENDTKIQISEEKLLDFIVEQEYNLVSYTNWSFVNLECDGLDEKYIDPIDYLTENRDEIIKDFIQANS